MSWLEHFSRFDKWGVWNKNVLGETFSSIRDLRVVISKNIDLDLNDSESFVGFFGSSLQNWSKLQDVLE